MREDMHEESIPHAPSAPPPPDSTTPWPESGPGAESVTGLGHVPEPDLFPPAPTPSLFGELDSRPHFLDEHGYQVSADGMFWWNGGTWVPGQPPGSQPFLNPGGGPANASPVPTAVQAAIAIGGLILFAGFAFSVCQSMPPGSGFPAP